MTRVTRLGVDLARHILAYARHHRAAPFLAQPQEGTEGYSKGSRASPACPRNHLLLGDSRSERCCLLHLDAEFNSIPMSSAIRAKHVCHLSCSGLDLNSNFLASNSQAFLPFYHQLFDHVGGNFAYLLSAVVPNIYLTLSPASKILPSCLPSNDHVFCRDLLGSPSASFGTGPICV